MRYRGEHRTQYDKSKFANANCTPTSGANAARCATGGRVNKRGADIRALVKTSEESNPGKPGWSLQDLDLAMSRLGVAFEIRRNLRWNQVVTWLDRGYGIVLQGDSDRFSDATCSGKFDGDHAVYVHPDKDGTKRLLGDPICRGWRWEEESVLQAYAEKFQGKRIAIGLVPLKVPDESQQEIEMELMAKGEPWRAVDGNGVFRDRPDREHGAIVARVPDGTIVRSTVEVSTLPRTDPRWATHGNWRLTRRVIEGKLQTVYMLRADWAPLVQGGDPVVDAAYQAFIDGS